MGGILEDEPLSCGVLIAQFCGLQELVAELVIELIDLNTALLIVLLRLFLKHLKLQTDHKYNVILGDVLPVEGSLVSRLPTPRTFSSTPLSLQALRALRALLVASLVAPSSLQSSYRSNTTPHRAFH